MNLRTSLLLVLVAVGAIGCAFSKGTVALNYQPTLPLGEVSAPKDAKTITVETLVDERGKDPLLLMNKVNGYGQKTSGAYMAERPVAELVSESLQTALKSAGFTLVEGEGRLLLKGQLELFDFDVVMGLVKGTLNARVVVNLSLQDSQTKKTVWHESLVGTGSHTSGSIMAEDYLRPAYKAAMDNLISKLLHSDSFRDAVQP